jgi:serine phosphatase RsbU (regulator of sigma subunit)
MATAGHGPILHYEASSGQVREQSVSNFPLALIGDVSFDVLKIASKPGDVLVIVTDGMTEIADEIDRELGSDPLSRQRRRN